MWSKDPLGYADGSLATSRVSLVGQAKGEDPDEEATQKRMPKGSEGGRGM